MTRCKICGAVFIRVRMSQQTCSDMICRREWIRQKERAKAERAAFKVRKERAKTLSQLAKEAEYYVNRYVRLRDRNKPCVSCDRPANWQGQWHASHLKSVGANSALRFNLWNINKACSICNNYLSGNIGEYKARLPARIGQERFDFIESHNRSRTFTRDYLARIRSVFAKRCRVLERKIKHAMQD